MIITRVKLTNWKNFKEVDVKLDFRAILIGPNASGKSNFLDALRFLRDVVKQTGGLQAAVENRGGVSKIRCLGARKRSDVEIEVHLAESSNLEKPVWKYLLSFKHTGGGIFKNEASILSEKVWSSKNGKWILDRKPSKNEDQESLKFTHLEQITANKKFREIYTFFNELQYLHIVPQLVRDADSYILSSKKEDFFGRNLLNKITKTAPQTRNSYLKKINEVLKLAVPQLKELTFVKDEIGIPHLEAIYEHWRPKAGKQNEGQFSDGTLRIIGFMWALLDGTETVLLEEPELYLNTEIVKQLPEFIAKMQRKKDKKRQVIITTHSYDFLNNQGIGAEEVIVLTPAKHGTDAKNLTLHGDILNLLEAGFTVAESALKKVSPKEIQKIGQLEIWAQ